MPLIILINPIIDYVEEVITFGKNTLSGLTRTLMSATPSSKPSFTWIALVLNELHCLLRKQQISEKSNKFKS